MYGLEMVRSSTIIKRGTIYVMLGRMENKGWVSSSLDPADGNEGSNRRKYQPTAEGRKVLRTAELIEGVINAQMAT